MRDYSALLDFERRYVKPKPGRTLIVGSKVYEGRDDRRPLFADAIGLDMLPGDGVDVVHNLEEAPPKPLGLFDHIECWSVLEHSRKPWRLAANLQRLLVPGGTLYLTAPMVWRVHGYPNDYFRFTKEGVRSLFDGIGWIQLCLAHEKLKRNDMVPTMEGEGGHPYFARTEVCGFGVRA